MSNIEGQRPLSDEDKKILNAGFRIASKVIHQEPGAEVKLKALQLRATAEPSGRIAKIFEAVKFWLDPGGFF